MSRTPRRRAAVVGTGHRAQTFVRALAARPAHHVAALCDPSPTRMAFRLPAAAGEPPVGQWEPDRFTDLPAEEDIDEVVVTTVDTATRPLWRPPVDVGVESAHEAHGGGDPRMLDALFGPVDPAGPADTGEAARPTATERDGALALAVGLAANRCFERSRPVLVRDLLPGL